MTPDPPVRWKEEAIATFPDAANEDGDRPFPLAVVDVSTPPDNLAAVNMLGLCGEWGASGVSDPGPAQPERTPRLKGGEDPITRVPRLRWNPPPGTKEAGATHPAVSPFFLLFDDDDAPPPPPPPPAAAAAAAAAAALLRAACAAAAVAVAVTRSALADATVHGYMSIDAASLALVAYDW